MKDTEAAWLAGLFDGDGSLNYERRAYRDDLRVRSPGAWRVRVRIGTSDKATADRIVELAGGRYHTGVTPAITPRGHIGGRAHYSWDCSAKLAREMLQAIQPYVVTKKARVDLALEAERIRIEAARTVGRTGVGAVLTDDAHGRLLEISNAIKALNMKGPKGRER